jgi:hypothetical protein
MHVGKWQYSSFAQGKDEWSGHAPPAFPPKEEPSIVPIEHEPRWAS